jgi:excisionase family DNA binding protein
VTTSTAEAAYTLSEAAGLKRVSQDYVRRAIRAGALRAKLIGKGYRIAASDLEAWWESLPDA